MGFVALELDVDRAYLDVRSLLNELEEKEWKDTKPVDELEVDSERSRLLCLPRSPPDPFKLSLHLGFRKGLGDLSEPIVLPSQTISSSLKCTVRLKPPRRSLEGLAILRLIGSPSRARNS